ncbi:pectinesterase inhibitor-like [Lycium barbarum]|uniref:pectinesterase inhibitor-like n=1 Tax=Lycium barbarum TaxID=112863 RepID=UPI00293EB71F|nr:pectinesterase inhibitor-like [Lycium barbarum]
MSTSSQFSLLILFFNLSLLIGFSFGHFIPSVCKQIKNETFCKEILGSNPKAKRANLFALEKIVINLTISRVNATNDKVNSLLLKIKDQNLRNIYGNCSSNYEDAVAFLEQAKLYLKYKQFWDLGYCAKDANLDASFCEESFKKADLPSPLTNDNYVLGLLCDIIVVISNMLLKINVELLF